MATCTILSDGTMEWDDAEVGVVATEWDYLCTNGQSEGQFTIYARASVA